MAHTEGHGGHGPLNHEPTDVNLAGAKRLLLGTFVFLALVFAGSLGLLYLLKGVEERRQPPPRPVVERTGDRLPPLPRLQTTPYRDIASFLADERATLERYAWVDRTAGIAQIPVARAIELLAAQGLPEAASGDDAPAPDAPASNSTGDQ